MSGTSPGGRPAGDPRPGGFPPPARPGGSARLDRGKTPEAGVAPDADERTPAGTAPDADVDAPVGDTLGRHRPGR